MTWYIRPVGGYKCLLSDMCVQLQNKWKYAANTYRSTHPCALPESKPHRNRLHSRLLPRQVAEEKLETWIPYAIAKLQEGFGQLASQFAVLTLEQVAAVEAEPDDNESDDES